MNHLWSYVLTPALCAAQTRVIPLVSAFFVKKIGAGTQKIGVLSEVINF